MLNTTTGAHRSAGIDCERDGVPVGVDQLVGSTLCILVPRDRILVNMIGHHARGQVMGFVEEHRLPCTPDAVQVGGRSQHVRKRASFSAVRSFCSSFRIQALSSIRLLYVPWKIGLSSP